MINIFLLGLFTCVCRVEAAEFIVFNVGQGNCNLFVPDKNGIPILYDAGSIHVPENIDGFMIERAAIIREITHKIESALPYHKTLNVVVSHGDRDHYGYIADVLKNLKLVKFCFFFGGSKSQYPKDFIKELESIPPMRRKTFCFADDASFVSPCIGDSYECKVLARPVYMDDKNASSLVLKISHATFSVLLMGDATDKTTRSIPETEVNNTTMLVANHHGADSFGSNNEAWVSKAKPEIAIFSASKSNHGHPNHAVVVRYLESKRLRNESLHEFSYAGTIMRHPPQFMTYNKVAEKASQKEYYRALTRKALFNTMNEGTMLLKLSNPLTVRPDKPFFSMFPIKNLTELRLIEMAMTNEEFTLIAPKLYILQLLRVLDLSKNHLKLKKPEGSEAINAVKTLLDKIAAIVKISLLENECSTDHIKETISDVAKLELPSDAPVIALKE